MGGWGCCTPSSTHPPTGGKVVQLRRAAAASRKRNRVAAPTALAVRPWVRGCTGASLSAVVGKVPKDSLVYWRPASSAQAATASDSEGEQGAKHGPRPPTKGTYWDPDADFTRAPKRIPLFGLAKMAVPMLARLTERALPFISRHIPTIDFLLVYLLIYNAVSVFANVLRLLVNGGWSPLPIAKVQVAVWDPQRQVQHQLERIAAKAYTAGASRTRLFILQETAKLLLNNKGSIAAVHLEAELKDYSLAAESGFNKMLAEEPGRLHAKESLPQKAPAGYPGSPRQDQREVTVVTLLVSGKGLQPLPQQRTKDSICTMLEALQQVTPHGITSYQVLWTPRGEASTYPANKLAVDYPLMQRF